MNKSSFITLLFLITTPAMASSYISCEKISLSSSFADLFFTPLSLFIFFILFFFIMTLSFSIWTRLLLLLAITLGSVIAVAILASLSPDMRPVINEKAVMSVPELARGRHYSQDCVRVYRTESSVTLACMPGGKTVTIPGSEYDAATDAYSQLELQKFNLPQSNICKNEEHNF